MISLDFDLPDGAKYHCPSVNHEWARKLHTQLETVIYSSKNHLTSMFTINGVNYFIHDYRRDYKKIIELANCSMMFQNEPRIGKNWVEITDMAQAEEIFNTKQTD